jgi:hypothetical protein
MLCEILYTNNSILTNNISRSSKSEINPNKHYKAFVTRNYFGSVLMCFFTHDLIVLSKLVLMYCIKLLNCTCIAIYLALYMHN